MNPRKKLSNFSKSDEWSRDSNNYVAKRYMGGEQRETYFEVTHLSLLNIFILPKFSFILHIHSFFLFSHHLPPATTSPRM